MPVDFKSISENGLANIGTMLKGLDANGDGKFSFNEVSKALGKDLANEIMDGNKPLDRAKMRDNLKDLFKNAGYTPEELMKGLKGKDADDIFDLNKKDSKKSGGSESKGSSGKSEGSGKSEDKSCGSSDEPSTDSVSDEDDTENLSDIEKLLKGLFGDNGIDIKDIAGDDGKLSGAEAAKALLAGKDMTPGGELTQKGYKQLTESMTDDQKEALDEAAGDDNVLDKNELSKFLTNEFSNATGDKILDVSELSSFTSDEDSESEDDVYNV
jgi:hypothetical protein